MKLLSILFIAIFLPFESFGAKGPWCLIAVDSVSDLGPLPRPPAVPGRDGGWSGPAFGKELWSFGDSFITTAGEDGMKIRSSTATWSDGHSHTNWREALTPAGIPEQFIPYTRDEILSNKNDSQNGWALWGGPVLFQKDSEVFLLYSKVHRINGNGFHTTGVGLAKVAEGMTIAIREAGLLFSEPEPLFGNGAAFVHGDFIYLYECEMTSKLQMGCRIARVPKEKIASRNDFQFYDGLQWVSEISKVAWILQGVASGFSVAWNEYAGAFVAVHSQLLGAGIWLRTAPAPEGPWSEPVKIPADDERILRPWKEAIFGNYLALQHPGLKRDKGREIFVTYSRPFGMFNLEVRAARIRIQKK